MAFLVILRWKLSFSSVLFVLKIRWFSALKWSWVISLKRRRMSSRLQTGRILSGWTFNQKHVFSIDSSLWYHKEHVKFGLTFIRHILLRLLKNMIGRLDLVLFWQVTAIGQSIFPNAKYKVFEQAKRRKGNKARKRWCGGKPQKPPKSLKFYRKGVTNSSKRLQSYYGRHFVNSRKAPVW